MISFYKEHKLDRLTIGGGHAGPITPEARVALVTSYGGAHLFVLPRGVLGCRLLSRVSSYFFDLGRLYMSKRKGVCQTLQFLYMMAVFLKHFSLLYYNFNTNYFLLKFTFDVVRIKICKFFVYLSFFSLHSVIVFNEC